MDDEGCVDCHVDMSIQPASVAVRLKARGQTRQRDAADLAVTIKERSTGCAGMVFGDRRVPNFSPSERCIALLLRRLRPSPSVKYMALLCGVRSPRCSTAVLVCKGDRSALERRRSPAIVRLLCAVAHNDPDVGQDEVHPRRVKTHDLESTTASYRSCFCRGREDKQQSPASTRTADGEWTCTVKQRGPITLLSSFATPPPSTPNLELCRRETSPVARSFASGRRRRRTEPWRVARRQKLLRIASVDATMISKDVTDGHMHPAS